MSRAAIISRGGSIRRRRHDPSRPLRLLLLAVMLATAPLIAGCPPREPVADRLPGPYTGPTLTLDELVARINANNARIESLWARGGFTSLLRESRDEPGRTVNGDVVLLYMAPDLIRMRAEGPGFQRVIDLGSDGQRFWLHLPTERQMYTGTFDGLDPRAAAQLPIRPDLVGQVLGVGRIDEDLLAMPAPTMRFNPDSDAYMLTFVEPLRLDGRPRLVAAKEVWYDRATLLPTVVILFNPDGRVAARAYLSRHVPVSDSDGPRVATHFDLLFWETGSTMTIRLFEDELDFRRGRFPQRRSFIPPDPAAEGVPDPIDLDAQ